MNTNTLRFVVWLIPCLSSSAYAQFEGIIDDLVRSHGDKVCADLAPLPVDSCKSVITAAGMALAGSSLDDVRDALKSELTDPDFLNSAVAKAFGSKAPLGLEFKALDGENGETVLGVSYAVSHEFSRTRALAGKDWNRHYSLAFDATGTVTANGDENPRNFLETKLTAFGIFSTTLPEQTPQFGAELQRLAVLSFQCEAAVEDAACQDAAERGYAMLDSTAEFIESFQYYEVGLNGGIETDQDFDAEQTTFGAYAFGQYESWGGGSLLDILNVVPAIRVGIDTVDPNDDSPRAMAGDSSSFTRFAGEISLWIPLQTSTPMALTFNYRHYREVDASSVIEAAGLASFNLRTFSLTGPNGLFASYSSGRLPLDLQSNNVIELGWRTYFQ